MSAAAVSSPPQGGASGVVIAGAGLAGWGLARELRKLAPEVPITIVTRDAGHFYAKPSLSNALAQRKAPDDLVSTPGAQLASQLRVTLLAHTTIERIEPQARTLRTSGGALVYDRLVLALGADPIRVPLAGDASEAVLRVNDLDDYRAFRSALDAREPVAILGAGLIGCEFANDLRIAGVEVEVIDPSPRPLAALLPARAGEWFAERLAGAGVRWRCNDAVEAVDAVDAAGAAGALRGARLVDSACGPESSGAFGRAFDLTLRSGARLRAASVLSAIGLRPRTALAQDAGIVVGRGIEVDRFGATSQPRVFALGDCAQYSGRVLPFVQPIITAAKALAATLSGTPTPIDFGAMPVIVKTPACPVVALAPQPGAQGRWEDEPHDDDGLAMRFVDEQDRLAGFVLLGAATARRRAMLAQGAEHVMLNRSLA